MTKLDKTLLEIKKIGIDTSIIIYFNILILGLTITNIS